MQSNKEEILKYIENEKSISRYKIISINASRFVAPSSKRILQIEEEFLNFPFENIIFDSVSDVAAAISLYRSSRHIFYRTYGFEDNPSQTEPVALARIVNISIFFSKLNELKDILAKLDFAIKNLQSKDFEQQLDEKDLQYFIENKVRISKRMTTSLCCAKQYLQDGLSEINKDITEEGFINLESKKISKRAPNNYLETTFERLCELQGSILKRSLTLYDDIAGRDKSILKNFLPQRSVVQRLSQNPPIKFSIEKDRHKKRETKTCGINLQLERTGLEKLIPIAASIKVNSIDITNLFCFKFSNFKIDGTYKRTLMIKPVAKFDDNDFKILQQLFPEVSVQKSSKEDLVNQLNRVTLDVDKNSFLIAPSSRRENEYFNFVYRWFILELKNLNL